MALGGSSGPSYQYSPWQEHRPPTSSWTLVVILTRDINTDPGCRPQAQVWTLAVAKTQTSPWPRVTVQAPHTRMAAGRSTAYRHHGFRLQDKPQTSVWPAMVTWHRHHPSPKQGATRLGMGGPQAWLVGPCCWLFHQTHALPWPGFGAIIFYFLIMSFVLLTNIFSNINIVIHLPFYVPMCLFIF